MAMIKTVNNRVYIKEVIMKPDIERARQVWAYDNRLGDCTTFEVYHTSDMHLGCPVSLKNAVLLYDRDEGVTGEGRMFMTDINKYDVPARRHREQAQLDCFYDTKEEDES
jgi:hypothetical protein